MFQRTSYSKKNPQKKDILVVKKINRANYSDFKMKAMDENRNVGGTLNQTMAD
ncbi:MAG: hypothetical protein ACYCSG_00590 [Thermoplasmataceae archaeon]